ncbi:MAG TPA: hypothetical protein VJT72_08915 [Pseudonocardiaceae bacterium]|nr:hypothetical protein [Pseudonocardiaceae bacterium]
METLASIVLVAAILVTFSVLMGCAFGGQLLAALESRQAAAQRSLNEAEFVEDRGEMLFHIADLQPGTSGQRQRLMPVARREPQ